MSDLIKRLRGLAAAERHMEHMNDTSWICDEAAVRLQQLEANEKAHIADLKDKAALRDRIKQLEAKTYAEAFKDVSALHEDFKARIQALEATIKRVEVAADNIDGPEAMTIFEALGENDG